MASLSPQGASLPLTRRHFLGIVGLGVAAAALPALPATLVEAAGPTGYPWQGQVSADTTTVRSQPISGAHAVGPVSRGSWLAVLGESGNWYQTPVGYVAKSDLARNRSEWVGEVAHNAHVFHKPNSKGPINRRASAGHLVRVTGVAAGVPLVIGGKPDNSVYWATTIGYFSIDAVRNSKNPWAAKWTLPSASQAPTCRWVSVYRGSNVRAGATTDSPILGRFDGSEHVKVLAKQMGKPVHGNAKWYLIDGGQYAGAYLHSSLIRPIANPKPNTTAPKGQTTGTWIVVDRRARSLTLVKDGKAEFTTYVAIGKAATQTPDGLYSTFYKLDYDTMASYTTTADATYYVPNVPWVQYYKEGGFAIHGTYWHDHFGLGTSQGCVNLTETDSAYLFGRTAPQLGSQSEAYAAQGATTVVIVD